LKPDPAATAGPSIGLAARPDLPLGRLPVLRRGDGSPPIASLLMKQFGPRALFLQNAYVHMGVAAVALWRRNARPRRTPASQVETARR